MSREDLERHSAPDAKLSIGVLSRAAGIPAMTPRTWERRAALDVWARDVAFGL